MSGYGTGGETFHPSCCLELTASVSSWFPSPGYYNCRVSDLDQAKAVDDSALLNIQSEFLPGFIRVGVVADLLVAPSRPRFAFTFMNICQAASERLVNIC